MAALKLGEPFGMDAIAVDGIDWSLAISRIQSDMKSDFIFSPHLGFLYSKAGQEISAKVKSDLKSGSYMPSLPITLEVPKSYRIRVAVQSGRLGPNFSRPGSILLPTDRIFFQALADTAAPIINRKTDRQRSFSHRPSLFSKSPNMFAPTRACWGNLQKDLKEKSKLKNSNYILRLDISNFFSSINQHVLINTLKDCGFPSEHARRLEVMLTSYTGDRSSRGILQGIYPSDLLGNFYMSPVDRWLSDKNIPSSRYVDDVYIFLESVDAADALMRELIPFLRSYDLSLNENKCVLMPRNSLITEEPDLEALFSNAVKEISTQVDDEDFDVDYGFQSSWDDDYNEGEKKNLELEATKILFSSVGEYPGHEENIERFCLPLFAKANSDFAVDHVIEVFKKRPAMTQIYAAYLSKFPENIEIKEFFISILKEKLLGDWQKMWVLAGMMQGKVKGDEEENSVKVACDILKDTSRHEALRAVAAIYSGFYGDSIRRRELGQIYSNVTPYIQNAIYFSSRDWPGTERANAKAMWGGLNFLNQMMTIAMGKK